MSQIFQQSKLVGCLWLLNKLAIITVAILSIALLIQDLMAEEQERFWKIVVPYAMLFILNTDVLVKTVTKTYEFELPLFLWLVIYVASMLLNCVGILVENKYWIPVNSKTAAEFIIFITGMNPLFSQLIANLITWIFWITMEEALHFSVLLDVEANPNLPDTFRGRVVERLLKSYTNE